MTRSELVSLKFPFKLSYPNPTPGGFRVQVNELPGDLSYRIHLVSREADEVYFEIGRYEQLARQTAIEQFLADVSLRFEELHSSPVIETQFNGLPVASFTIQWSDRERAILFFERDGALFRIIYDPRSAINLDILNSLKSL